jgi:phenylacetate-CoA ligase
VLPFPPALWMGGLCGAGGLRVPAASGPIREIYDKAPRWMRRSVRAIPFGWRIGPVYRSTLRFLLESDRWTAEALVAYQDERLDALLERAIRFVPAYGRYRSLLGKPPRNILKDIEPVSKQDIQSDPGRYLDQTVPASAVYETSTGGTSGQPLKILLDKRGFQIEWAFMVAQWMRAGYRPGMRKATFRGVAFPGGQLWQENPVYDELQFSPFSMSEANLPRYAERLAAYAPDFLYGYPSALSQLAHYYEAHPEHPPPPVRALLCGSENVREGQREYLERVFKTRFYSWYGMSEKVVLAGECEGSSLYHAFPQYGVTELLDERGELSDAPGAEGELVGTGFMNQAMPFIRYRLGDYARVERIGCEHCRRAHLLLGSIRGRWVQEMVVGRTGAKISLTALNMHGKVFDGVRRFQFHQKEMGRVTLRLIAAASLSEADLEGIKDALKNKTGDEVVWSVETVKDLPLSPRGKGVFLVKELGNEG